MLQKEPFIFFRSYAVAQVLFPRSAIKPAWSIFWDADKSLSTNFNKKIASRQFCFFCCQKKKATMASGISKMLYYSRLHKNVNGSLSKTLTKMFRQAQHDNSTSKLFDMKFKQFLILHSKKEMALNKN